jgi:hypothetical protein
MTYVIRKHKTGYQTPLHPELIGLAKYSDSGKRKKKNYRPKKLLFRLSN